jgi:hypothetical protein
MAATHRSISRSSAQPAGLNPDFRGIAAGGSSFMPRKAVQADFGAIRDLIAAEAKLSGKVIDRDDERIKGMDKQWDVVRGRGRKRQYSLACRP